VIGKLSDTPGWQPTQAGKVDAGKAYARALATGRFLNYSRPAILELNDFVLTIQSTMQHSPSQTTENVADARENHGDRVIADMLANLGMEEGRQGVPVEPLSKLDEVMLKYGLKPKPEDDGSFDTGDEPANSFE
jgi:hypothetical protein